MPRCAQCTANVEHVGDVCGACAATVFAGAPAHASLPVVSSTVPVGTVLADKWRIEGVLGRGGMGVVLLAHDLALGRKVAVKFLADHLCVRPDFVARFEREAQLTARLVHPNIVHVYDVGQHEGRPFLVMQHLEGLPLSEYLKSQPCELKAAEVLAIARQLCAGLEFIHARGFVHRDIKPGNLFIAADGHLTLLDFGVLKLSALEDTSDGSMIGTLAYMAPEQLHGEPADARSDVFAAAIVLAEVAGGCRAAADLAQRAPWVPSPVADVLARGMSASADERFASAAELLDALERAYAYFLTPQPGPRAVLSASRPRKKRKIAVASGVLALVAGALVYASAGVPRAARTIAEPEPRPTAATALDVSPERTPPPAAPAPVARTAPKTQRRADAALEKTRHATPARKKPAADVGTLRVVTLTGDEVTWAHVHINGKPQGESPLTVQLPVGVHAVRVERAGFQAVERSVRIRPRARALVRVELKP